MEFKSEKTKNWISISVAVALCFFVLFLPTRVLNYYLSLSFENAFYISRFLLWFGLLCLFIYVKKVERQKFLRWEEKKYSIVFYIISIPTLLIVTLIGLIFFSIIMFLTDGLPKPSNTFLQITLLFRDNYPLTIFTCFTAAVVEELIFRGYIQTRLQIIFKNKFTPIIISSVLFGILHIGFGTLINVLGPICIGLVFALFYEKYRNIKVLMICHFLWDFLLIMLQLHFKLK